MGTIAELDKRYLWHPFTQMSEWVKDSYQPVVIVEAEGAVLRAESGEEFLDGNASIWTNIHGHRHPSLDEALKKQIDQIAHSSFLGLTNDVAPRLGEALVELLQPGSQHRVFFSDDGSTAMEAGLKMIFQARQQRGEMQRQKFLSLGGAYHGDTVGAMSLGKSELFHYSYGKLLFETREVMSPACYRCPYNRSKPEKGVEARFSRKCNGECLEELEKVLEKESEELAAFVLEPRIQGAAGLWMHPHGYLEQAAELCRQKGVWIFLDEVLTGFGRTGAMLACHHEEVVPDVIGLAKGLTAGYLPLAATLASQEIFDSFLGKYEEFKTFFHGHSYTGNALGCAVALENLAIFEKEQTLKKVESLSQKLNELSMLFWEHPQVGEVRQEGAVVAIELVEEFDSKKSFPLEKRVGHWVCEAAKKYGLLTRPIGNVLVLMPPYCTSEAQLDSMVQALWKGLNDVLPIGKQP